MPPMFLLAGGGSLRGLARRALASRMASPLAAGLAEVQKRRRLSRYRRIIRQADPALTVSLLELTDLATPWSDNYTKPVDEAYVQANWQHHSPCSTSSRTSPVVLLRTVRRGSSRPAWAWGRWRWLFRV
jgi:hypothetical protein